MGTMYTGPVSPGWEVKEPINSPFRWVGGKSRLRKYIIDLIPTHSCYLEVFGGAAWVLFGKKPSPVEILNDIDQELMTFFRVVKERPEDLIASFEMELVSRSEFDRLAAHDPTTLSDVQRAHRFYYLIMAGWGGELNYPRFQTSVFDGGGGNRLVGALRTLKSRLKPVHERLSTVLIECLDWRECIERYDRDGVLAYIDPPYPGNGCNYKHNMRDWTEHRELAARLHRAKFKWIYSSYDSPEVRDMFCDLDILEVSSASGMIAKKGGSTRVMNREVLITNFAPPQGSMFANGQHQSALGFEPDEA
jgi:DNA adenine methylase